MIATATFTLAELRIVARAANRFGPRLIVLRGQRRNGIYVWLSADDQFRRIVHSNLIK